MVSNWSRTVASVGISLSLVLLSSGGSAFASTGSNYQNKINQLSKQKTQTNQKVDQIKKQITDNKNQQQTIQQQLSELQNKIAVAIKNIQSKQSDITGTKKDISTLNAHILVVKTRIKKRDVLLKDRVKAMYETGTSTDALQLLLSSQNFGDFISRVLALNTIANNDQRILNQQKKDQQTLVTQETSVTKKLESLQKDLKQLDAMNQSLADQKKKQQSLLAQLKSQAKTLEKEQFSQQEIAANLAKEQAATQRAYDLWKEAQAKQASSGNPASSSGLAWPIVNGWNHITSPYGYRTFLNEFHHGIDIGVPEMTPIHAAADGVVSRAYPSSSYGNVVFLVSYIKGHKYTTVYAHENHYIVHDGETVKQGQVIGYVGHTGQAFGSHLHFAVYDGDWTPPPHPNTINPMNMLPKG